MEFASPHRRDRSLSCDSAHSRSPSRGDGYLYKNPVELSAHLSKQLVRYNKDLEDILLEDNNKINKGVANKIRSVFKELEQHSNKLSHQVACLATKINSQEQMGKLLDAKLSAFGIKAGAPS